MTDTRCDLCAARLSAEALQAENERLRKALEFYAEEATYRWQPYADTGDGWKPIDDDMGDCARKALQEGKE